MSLVINHNISALNTHRNMGISSRNLAKSLEKLSSGYKINVAADDPSGLIISEQLRSQVSSLQRAVQNSQEASNVIAITEGALIEMNEILRKLRSLALHAANSGVTSPDQTRADQAEVDSSIQTIDRIATTTRYSDQFLLNGSKGLVFDRVTTVNTPMDHPLLNVQATRIDQVFKREGVSMSISFSGVKNATQADYTKQATRAMFEADDNNANCQINGNVVTARQEFILTGTRGSRLFSFAENTSLGTIVDSINNVRESTGVGATLIFSSNVTPTQTTGAWAQNRVAGNIQVYGANLNATVATSRKISACSVTLPAAAAFRAGLNCDGHAQIYAKVVSTGANASIEWYKDSACTMLIGTGNNVSFNPMNGSGIPVNGLLLTTTGACAKDDVYTVCLAGLEINTSLVSDYVDTTSLGLTNLSLNNGSSVISGVELGRNTSLDGRLYFRASGAAASRTIEVFKDSQMLPESLVATGTANLSAAGSIRLESVTMADGTPSGLNLTLTFSGAASSATETGVLAFNELGIRLYSLEYGSQQYVRIQNNEGQLFYYYRLGDNTQTTMVEEGSTAQQSGQDATISLNGAPVGTQGIVANITTPDFSGSLTFHEGKLGETRIAKAGYDVGALFSRATALQSVADAATPSLINTFTYATNARHATTETLSNYIGGMQFQLGGGDGDQERTVYGIQNMAAVNIGRITYEGKTYTLQDVLAGGSASLQNNPIIALRIISQAVNDVSELRARLGAFQKNMLQTNINSLQVTVQNITATESSIRDADMAAETTEFTKNQIMLQAGTAMLAQANTASQNILQLLG